MDNFVFAVLPKKTATKMQKELQDLVDNKPVPGSLYLGTSENEREKRRED